MTEIDKPFLKTWVRWILGDAPMPKICILYTHDLVMVFGQIATAHERMEMIARYPVLIEAMNLTAWIGQERNLNDPRVVAFFDEMPEAKRRELTDLRKAIEEYLKRIDGRIYVSF